MLFCKIACKINKKKLFCKETMIVIIHEKFMLIPENLFRKYLEKQCTKEISFIKSAIILIILFQFNISIYF